jgi:hypothetical protein
MEKSAFDIKMVRKTDFVQIRFYLAMVTWLYRLHYVDKVINWKMNTGNWPWSILQALMSVAWKNLGKPLTTRVGVDGLRAENRTPWHQSNIFRKLKLIRGFFRAIICTSSVIAVEIPITLRISDHSLPLSSLRCISLSLFLSLRYWYSIRLKADYLLCPNFSWPRYSNSCVVQTGQHCFSSFLIFLFPSCLSLHSKLKTKLSFIPSYPHSCVCTIMKSTFMNNSVSFRVSLI